jgi:hypothetical protein
MAYRKVHIGGEEYRYSIGKTHVKIVFPNGKVIAPMHWEVCGFGSKQAFDKTRSDYLWERLFECEEKNLTGLYPSTIKSYIERVIS